MAQRMTPLRQQILDILRQKHMVSAMDLLKEIQKAGLDVNKTTVYRGIEFLLEEGLICQHQFDPKEAVYELRDHHHDHLICNTCGRVQESACVVHPPEEISGFTVDHHHLTLYGVCAKCNSISS